MPINLVIPTISTVGFFIALAAFFAVVGFLRLYLTTSDFCASMFAAEMSCDRFKTKTKPLCKTHCMD